MTTQAAITSIEGSGLSSVFGCFLHCLLSTFAYHLVLKICPQQLEKLSDHHIMDRWCSLFKGPLLVQRYRAGEKLSTAERDTVSDIVNVWRNKLLSISWFMRCLNQNIAFQANREDHCTGKFWEYRFKSQALKTEEALLSCMAYVDLNPIRAQMARSPETSDYTSIQERIQPTFNLKQAIQEQTAQGDIHYFEQALKPLLHFDEATTEQEQNGIPCAFSAYLELVDWTGRAIRDDKRGHIDNNLPPILQRLNLSSKQWLVNTTQFEAIHHRRFSRRFKKANTA